MVVGEQIINGGDEILDYVEMNKFGKRNLIPALDENEREKHDALMAKLSLVPI